MTNIDASTAVALGLASFVIIVALYVWTALALSAVFSKSAQPAWQAWVPVVNMIVLLRLGGVSPWLLLLILVPVLGALAVWVLIVIAAYRVNLAFGFGAGMTVLAAISLPIWASVLGFGSARWLGSEAESPGPRRTDSAGVAAAADAGTVRGFAPDAGFSFAPERPASERFAAPAASTSSSGPRRLSPLFDAPVVASPSAATPLPSFAPAAPVHAPESGTYGIVGDVTSEVTAAVAGAPLPVSAVPGIAPVSEPPAWTPTPVNRPAPVAAQSNEPWIPPRLFTHEADVFPERSGELSGDVSAVAGAPDAGSPRSALGSVSALYAPSPQSEQSEQSPPSAESEIPENLIEETVIVRRKRTDWSLVPPFGAAVALRGAVVIVGRKPGVDAAFPGAQLVSIDDGTVSKTHARLELRGDRWYITDLGSTNGVLFATLMGTEVEATPGVEVEAGERFFLGDAELRLLRSDG